MKSLLITAAITTFLLALLLHSGNALLCYNCPVSNCDRNITCKAEEDSCLIIYHGGENRSQCWNYSKCKVELVSQHFGIKNFRYRCCQTDLCNNAPTLITSKIVLSGAFLLTVVHILKSLVWN